MGSGKSTLAMALGRALADRHGVCQMLSLDPGTPLFGVPGAVCRGWWNRAGFQWGDLQALCTLDAGRFRLPLLTAAHRLDSIAEKNHDQSFLLLDPPGVVRGVGAAELLHGLVALLKVAVVVAVGRPGKPLPLAAELATLSCETIAFGAACDARRPTMKARGIQRTHLWDRYLGAGELDSAASLERAVSMESVNFVGTPPPPEAPAAWVGRQAALMGAGGQTLAMGEVVRLEARRLILRLASAAGSPTAILLRDAGRNDAGQLETLPATNRKVVFSSRPVNHTAREAGRRPVSARVGSSWATLVGGVLGDPLLHVRLRHRKESLLFDLGDASRLSTRVAHQVRAVFLSHAHLDHIGGFIWFLRARIGVSTDLFGPCRIFGPPDTLDRIESFLNAITWDRIEANGPIFEVGEIHADRLKSARIQAGRPRVDLPDRPIEAGVVFASDNYRVAAATCDHKIPSVAYALIFDREINVRKERLADLGWPAGPWLGQLKRCIAAEALRTEIQLPDGATRSVGDLVEVLTLIRPGKRLVYAADMADNPANRRKLIDLARDAHILVCETAFCEADRQKARATQHLTTRAAVEIARAAGVQRLAPFHFSKRYEDDPARIYAELRGMAGPVMIVGRP